ncbi:MAG: hypothetical protein ACRC0G_01080 [Fusobacteriaceae bacterium]
MLEFVLVCSMFTFGFRLQEIFSIIYLLINCNRQKFSIKTIIMLSIIVIIQLVILTLYNISYFKAIQQLIIVIIVFLSYKLLFEKIQLKTIFNKYLKVSKLIIFLGLIQFLIYTILKKDIFYFVLGRTIIKSKMLSINSISGEPGMFVQLILPAVIYTIEEDWFIKKKTTFKLLIYIMTVILTNTAVGYFVLGVYLISRFLMSKINIFKKLIFFIVFIVLIFLIISYDKMVYMKITQSLNIFYYLEENNLKTVNLSTFALYSNLKAFINSKNYLFGNGFGSIENTYYKYFKNIGYSNYGLNSTDGYSLINRVLSEFGILGIIFVYGKLLIETIKIFKYKRNVSISIAALFGIISYSIRGGSYFMHGTIFFILLLIYSNKKSSEEKV